MTPFLDLQELDSWETASMHHRYNQMYRVLVSCLNNKTREFSIEFSGTFARLDFLCRELKYKESSYRSYRQICAFRGRCTHLKNYTDQQLQDYYRVDMRALCEFVSVLCAQPVPEGLRSFLSVEYPDAWVKERIAEVLRCSVSSLTAEYILLSGPLGEEFILPWRYAINAQQGRDLEYLRRILKPGSQLNLVRPWEEDGRVLAEQVIYEPDILVDISTICKCFEPIGTSPYHYLFKLLENSRPSSLQLLGTLAGQMLDEEVHHLGEEQSNDYTDSIKRFFAEHTLPVVSCSEFLLADKLRDFHQQARQQQQNLRRLVQRSFNEDRSIDLQKVVLEPSFYCEMLGLQGRMDLLQSDKHVLMEQKSGKMDEYRHTHQISHFAQVLLYQAMLHYAYRDDKDRELHNDDIASYLLYSRYPDGLLKEAPAPRILDEALKTRNQIAYLQILLSRGEAEHLFTHLTPEVLNVDHKQGVLWDVYIRPRLEETLDKINKAPALEQAYFYRMFTFVAREHLLSKVGTSHKEASGFAALWNCTSAEKREAGDLLDHLQIIEIGEDRQTLTLLVNEEESGGMLPNFRTGDIVVLYRYPTLLEPDARRDMVFRASIVEITSTHIIIRLRGQQRNIQLFQPEGEYLWAVEHDFMESSYGGLYRGLYSFLEATPQRKALLLGQRQPEIDESLSLANDYGAFNDLVLRAKQAKDYFLLIGPPGTGKTSHGLVNILNEHLSSGHDRTNILLVSFTNRAVDEICSKLVKMEQSFLRIGSELSCPEEYHPYLLSTRCKQYHTAQEIRNMIQGSRVVVGTTTAMTSNNSLFELKQFDLCIIDEASQILEPHLLALLSARHQDEDAIRKFVMIGDHKQLPAVVQQTEAESAVHIEMLRDIGLHNCRQSLFERFIRINSYESPLIYTLKAQGRMHHDLAEFANHFFYGDQLCEVPLGHQLRAIPYHTRETDTLSQMLTHRRISFVDVKKEREEDQLISDKVNLQEAEHIARSVYSFWRLLAENDMPFDPLESVGVIVPYRHQIATIKKALERFDVPELQKITIDTVERYQGSQRDLIIYGFTISRPYQLDFLTNNCFEEDGKVIDRKLNVALTRARELMVLVGDEQLLRQNPLFASLIDSIGPC